jgi:hypothetical protein
MSPQPPVPWVCRCTLLSALLLACAVPAAPAAKPAKSAAPSEPARAVDKPIRPVPIPPRFIRHLESANGKNRSLSADELAGIRKALLATRTELHQAQSNFVATAVKVTGLTEAQVTGTLPLAGRNMDAVDNLLAEKAARSGDKLDSEAASALRAALRDYEDDLRDIRDDLVENIAKVTEIRRAQIDHFIAEDGFLGAEGRAR